MSSNPQPHSEELVSQVAAVLKESESLVRDEQDYHQWCARRVLDAIRGQT